MRQRSAAVRALLASLCVGLAACIVRDGPPEHLLPQEGAAEASSPLAGEALGARKRDLQRAHHDVIHFQATLRTLRHRKDRNGRTQFSHFLDSYLAEHLEPMLEGEWQSRHPELSALDF